MGKRRGEEKRREEGRGWKGRREARRGPFNNNNALVTYKSNKSQSSLNRLAQIPGDQRDLKVIRRFFLISLE